MVAAPGFVVDAAGLVKSLRHTQRLAMDAGKAELRLLGFLWVSAGLFVFREWVVAGLNLI